MNQYGTTEQWGEIKKKHKQTDKYNQSCLPIVNSDNSRELKDCKLVFKDSEHNIIKLYLLNLTLIT